MEQIERRMTIFDKSVDVYKLQRKTETELNVKKEGSRSNSSRLITLKLYS